MKVVKFTLISAFLAAAFMVPWLVHHRAMIQLRSNEESLKEQTALLLKLSVQNAHISNNEAMGEKSRTISGTQLGELLKLRSEIGQLRQNSNEIEQVRHQIKRLHDRLQDAALEAEQGRDIDTALLADELKLRQWRVSRLKHWLEDMPKEKIPELQFISDDHWNERVDRPLVSDDDYRAAIGLLRADGEQKFVPMAFKALKQYAEASQGQFPTDVLQLQPYFSPPINPAILERYEVVPAKSLTRFLAETGGDWLITQKAPVNSGFDGRAAIGLKNFRSTVGSGRWDPVP